jgi:biofilm PGA synthesis N-glycosyltransferase PgaC
MTIATTYFFGELFWIGFAVVVYTYAAYPLAMAATAKWLRRDRWRHASGYRGSVSLVVAAHNEERSIRRRVEELQLLLSDLDCAVELIVVSDGSTDATAEIVRECDRGDLTLVEIPKNVGKAAALNAGCEIASKDVLVFADARQSWAKDSLKRLLGRFSSEEVGAISGDLVIGADGDAAVLAGVGMYWRYEKWLRRNESRVHSTVGVSGCISAVRRKLFRPIPAGTVLDDLYWPMQVVMQGYRVIHEEGAVAFDKHPASARDEFRRKVRTQAGNWQLVGRLPRLLVPYQNPIWLQYVSHKLMRLLVPWALAAMLIASALVDHLEFRLIFVCQLMFYAFGAFGIAAGAKARPRWSLTIASFLLLNAAAWLGFWVWATGGTTRAWKKANYDVDEVAVYGRPAP